MSIRDELLRDIERFLDRTGMDHTRFGKEALNDPAFVSRLRAGKDVRTRTVERIRKFLTDNRRRPLGRGRGRERVGAAA